LFILKIKWFYKNIIKKPLSPNGERGLGREVKQTKHFILSIIHQKFKTFGEFSKLSGLSYFYILKTTNNTNNIKL
jgi:hypothetical protein